MKCRRCGSENTNIYEAYEPEEHIGHGCLWWIFIGWWWWLICAMFGLIGAFIAFLTTFSVRTVKKKHKYCYCRDCGYEEELE